MRPKAIDNQLWKIDTVLESIGRYKTVVIVHESPLTLAQLAKECSIHLQGTYIHILDALSPQLTDKRGLYSLGICEYPDLIKWILELSYKSTNSCLIVNKIEPLVATFGRGNATEFFQALGDIEPKVPIIWFTYLDHQLIDANFPTSRQLRL